MIPTRFCRRHPRARAGWNCANCHADLCPDCVATQTLGLRRTPVDVCCECQRSVKPLTVHRAEAVSFWNRILDAPRFPLGSTGLLSMAFVGLIQALTSYAGLYSMTGGAAFLLRQGLFWGFLYFIVRSTADGAKRMGVFGFRDIHSDIITPALKGILATALLWLPATIYVVVVSDEGFWGILQYPWHTDPVVWGLALVGVIYVPMALLAGATDLGLGAILNPVRIFITIGRMGRDYFTTVTVIAVLVVLGLAVDLVLARMLAHVPIPFLPRWLGATISLYAPFVAAHVLGLLLYTRGEALDWGRGEDYQVPVLPYARPQGVLRDKPAAPEAAKIEPAPDDPLTVSALAASPVQPAPATDEPPLELVSISSLGLPPLPPSVAVPAQSPPLEAHAFYEPEPEPPVDLPPAVDAPAPVASLAPAAPIAAPPAPARFPAPPTVHGFSPSDEILRARKQQATPDHGATVVGHASVLVDEQAARPSPEAPAGAGKDALPGTRTTRG